MRPFVAKRDAETNVPWQVLAGGDRTGGHVTFGEAHIPPGSPGPGRHVHMREDEAIYVVAGVLTVEVGDRRFEADSGSLVWLPRGIPHIFANLSNAAIGEKYGVTAVPGPPLR